MRRFLYLIMLVSWVSFAQTDFIAREYFKNGQFEKALFEYKKLYAQSPSNINYINQIVALHQELEQYNEAETFLLNLSERFKYAGFLVELGYNYQLMGNQNKAQEFYNEALGTIDKNPNNVFTVAKGFQSHTLLNETIQAYKKAMALKPDFNFNLQLAQLNGEQGNIEDMFIGYLDFAEANPIALSNVKRFISDFISENADNENNILFRKILLKKMQQEPNILWNEMLSWLFIQQNDYNKAFVQEKAIFMRQPESLDKIEDLGAIAFNENELELASEIYTFIIETAQDTDELLFAHYQLIQIETKTTPREKYEQIDKKYQDLFAEFGLFTQTFDLQLGYGHFLAFLNNTPEKAIEFLENTLKLPLNDKQQAEVKLELGDILVLQEQFNKALLYYTQIQRNLKNSTISQEARFRVAKTSYYKGDFKWAESQLNILKASTSQLIANDALDLKLLISDNKYEDSLQTSLKLYARADLMAFQNKNDEAILVLDKILKEHKTEGIVPQALFKQAQLFEEKEMYDKARENYEFIINNFSEGILIDDALFNLADLFEHYFNEPEKAKSFYEQIIFQHADSIYFVDARKRYRALRGDFIN
ncbi:tetratricopeptide repeat protein [Aestuariibaculum sediminum]|uniref:Tetratricopeptide repeat protein n=1 Tax=Aestuariibaculum sediminum TaxID=2770637 RepID=A0A8J6PZ11_9FLAO|nr:tetratricopeptide repeat protein [Aestuariibaculum sediminum]MBD0831442.1 tetratricopeptide repeat protein [Aestuariibaculum sediminum]